MTSDDSRYNVKFSDRQNEALERMAEELKTTKADVLRKALSLLDLTLREMSAGNQLCIAKDGVIVKEIVGIF